MANDSHNDGPFSEKLRVPEALTFDDVLLRPKESRVEPDDADVKSRVSKNVELNVPVLSAAMDTVTESEMAIGMARQGGFGVLHRNMDVEAMVEEIERVKHADELIIRDVVTASPEQTVREVDTMMARNGVSGAPVVDDDDEVLGIISGTDIRPYLEVGEKDEVQRGDDGRGHHRDGGRNRPRGARTDVRTQNRARSHRGRREPPHRPRHHAGRPPAP